MNTPVTLLDCTLRDGGYYTSWDFPRPLVERYLGAMDRAGVDVVEIGFRAMRGEGFRGAYAFSTDDHLRSLPRLSHARLCVMVNAKDMISLGGGDAACAAGLAFAPRRLSPVSMVRVAAHADEVERCGGLCAALSELGYDVGFNIMQASERSVDDLRRLARVVESWRSVGALYFADSLGSMTTESVRATVETFQDGWGGPIGFHAHDNCNMALTNALAARDAGAAWIDGTVLGMGRGAGNAQTEYLLAEFRRLGFERFRPEALLDILFNDFQPLRARHQWGPNLLYFLGAAKGIHPTYVQQMLGAERYSPDDVACAIEALAYADGHSFSTKSLDTAIAARFTSSEGAWRAPTLPRDASGVRTALLVASTRGLERHADAVEALIRRLDPTVFVLNEPNTLRTPVEYVVASHPTRVAGLLQRIRSSTLRLTPAVSTLGLAAGAESHAAFASSMDHPRTRLITPAAALDRETRDSLGACFDVCDFGLRVDRSEIAFGPSGCVAPSADVGAYALCAAAACGAERILLAGFDGHGPGDERTRAMNAAIEQFRRAAPGVRIVAITPTEYPVEQASVYDDALPA